MALAIDASTPAIATGTTTAITTASFTPPNGSAIVILFGSNSQAAGDTSITSITNTGTAITWTRRARKNKNASSDGGAGVDGGAEIWTGVGTGGAITVTVNGLGSGTTHEKAVQAVVLTGADTTAFTNIAATSSSSGLPSSTVAGCSTGSYVYAAASDWNAAGAGTAGSGQTIVSESIVAGQISIHFWRTTNTLSGAGSQAMNLTAPSAQQYDEVAIEIKATASATVPPPSNVARRVRRFPFPRRQTSSTRTFPPVVLPIPVLPPQASDRQRPMWLGKASKRASVPVPASVVVVTAQGLPPQPPRDRPLPFPRRRAQSSSVVTSVVLVPAQPSRRRLVPVSRRRAISTTVVNVRVTLPPQPGRDRLVPIVRRRANSTQPPAPAQIVVTAQALPPQPGRPVRALWLPRAKPRRAEPVRPQVVVVTAQALPPQPGRPVRVPWLPRARARQAQPVRPQVVVVTTQPLPAQPARTRLLPPRARRARTTQVLVTLRALPPQPQRDRLLPPLLRRARSTVVTSVGVYPPVPGVGRRRRFPFKLWGKQAAPPLVTVTVVSTPGSMAGGSVPGPNMAGTAAGGPAMTGGAASGPTMNGATGTGPGMSPGTATGPTMRPT